MFAFQLKINTSQASHVMYKHVYNSSGKHFLDSEFYCDADSGGIAGGSSNKVALRLRCIESKMNQNKHLLTKQCIYSSHSRK
jgi:hypothetical protein